MLDAQSQQRFATAIEDAFSEASDLDERSCDQCRCLFAISQGEQSDYLHQPIKLSRAEFSSRYVISQPRSQNRWDTIVLLISLRAILLRVSMSLTALSIVITTVITTVHV